MAKSQGRVSFSRKHLALTEIHLHHADIEASIRVFFDPSTSTFLARFAGSTQVEVNVQLQNRLAEHERSTAMNLLAAIEAAFRIDYLQRCYKKKKDTLSRQLREIYREHGSRASFQEQILEAWKDNVVSARPVLSDLMGALNYRHWLAHGRYWTPKLGRQYDYATLYLLAQSIFASFPFEGA